MSDAVRSGQVIAGRYRLLRRAGQGGMATVHLAEDVELGRHVAVKVLHEHLALDDEARRRFHREARHAASLSHPDLVTIHDYGVDGRPFIVMEWIDGGTLREHLRDAGPLPTSEAVDIVVAVGRALTVVHEASLVHRDVKPENVLLSRTGPKLADFGIARALTDPTLTAAGAVLGSLRYLAPELLAGAPPSARSDQYALGVLAAETLAGASVGPDGQRAPAPARRAVTPGSRTGVDTIIARATAADPVERHPSVAAFTSALGAAHQRADEATRVRTSPYDRTVGASTAPAAGPARSVDRRAPARPATATQRGTGRRSPRWRRVLKWTLIVVAVLIALDALPDNRTPSADSADAAQPQGESAQAPMDGDDGSGTGADDDADFSDASGSVAGGRDGQGSERQGPLEDAGDDGAAQAEQPGLGDEVRDGSLAFTVTAARCLGRRLGDQVADGRYCRVDVTVENIGDEPHTMAAGLQRLLDGSRNEYKADDGATIAANWGGDMQVWWGDVNPGQTVAGAMVFDIPRGRQPVAIRLHDGWVSDGAVVRLR